MVPSGCCSWNPERQNLEIGDVITFEKMAPEIGSGMVDVAHFEYNDVSGSFSPNNWENPDLSYLKML